ncbi:F-box protein family [Quillaja saponaria]|uniref:F-box protein family n=1 Tax=Quillaja saponaria TaxID=32244 RepID=A0AAD7VEI0_QUISA|nr:F-box protein family [Quillaja saponaria]
MQQHNMSTEASLRTIDCKGKSMRRQWSDLPSELLSRIADTLGLIELLAFRGVSKDWNSASLTASGNTESSRREPWFLIYGENSQCVLFSNLGTKYTINIPEMEGATCLASNQGWLLVFNKGSMFFFCPFSRAKIDLPMFPYAELCNHVAVFSSPPTSQDCIVTVISRSNELFLELNMIHRGDNAWTKHTFQCLKNDLDAIRGGVYCAGEFNFLDCKSGLVTFSAKGQNWTKYYIVTPSTARDPSEELGFRYHKRYFETEDMERKLKLENCSISTCGTLIEKANSLDMFILNESSCFGSENCSIKGVWLQPRFFQISSNQSWSLEEA